MKKKKILMDSIKLTACWNGYDCSIKRQVLFSNIPNLLFTSSASIGQFQYFKILTNKRNQLFIP